MDAARVVVLGLDSMPPELLFDRLLPWMPRVGQLLRHSRVGVLRSTDPPITIPAWATMFTGSDPGSLGLYGFRHRRPGSYFDMYAPSPKMIRHPPVWDLLSRAGRRVCVIGMPPGYPPPPVNGVYVGDLLTPAGATDWVSPSPIGREIETASGKLVFDVTFRASDRPRVAEEILAMTRRRYAVARYLWKREAWDFFALHDIGPDRMHHAFWKFLDPSHPRFRADPAMHDLLVRYYRVLDEEIGAFLDLVGAEPIVIVASDHGSQAMQGAFCINEWLQKEGYLVLRGEPLAGTPLEECEVDWPKTRVWGAGGYYARLQFNVRGREPEGMLETWELPALVDQLRKGLDSVTLPNGKPLGVVVHRPEDIYRQVLGDPPDLMVYFGDLRWRSAGTVGHKTLFLEENDTGPDDSVHSMDGILIRRDPESSVQTALPPHCILDVGPTLLRMMNMQPGPDVQGQVMADLL